MAKLRMIQRLLSMPALCPPVELMDVAMTEPQRQRIIAGLHMKQTALASSSNIHTLLLNDVAAQYAADPKTYWSYDEIPYWIPPWQFCVVEWDEPECWNMNGKLCSSPLQNLDAQLAQVCFTINLQKYTAQHRQMLEFLLSGLCGADLTALQKPTEWEDMLEVSSSIVYCEPWITWFSPSLSGMPLWLGCGSFVFVRDDGSYVGSWSVGVALNVIKVGSDGDGNISEEHSQLATFLQIAGLGFSHCHSHPADLVRAQLEKPLKGNKSKRTLDAKVDYYKVLLSV
jgi:hypothetical protein